jgi:hypothetical protein
MDNIDNLLAFCLILDFHAGFPERVELVDPYGKNSCNQRVRIETLDMNAAKVFETSKLNREASCGQVRIAFVFVSLCT